MDTNPGPYILTGASSFAMADPSQLATQDVLYCLNSPQDLTYISGTGSFVTATSSTLVSNFAASGTLGPAIAPSIATSGCAWYPTKFDFLNGLSVYFKLTINSTTTNNSGLTLVLADTTNNTSTINLCGGSGTNGQYLGYASTDPVSGGNIKPPKIGLELDMRRDLAGPDAGVSSTHAAFVYWGTRGSGSYTYDDDNTHGSPPSGLDTEPKNQITIPLTPPPGGIALQTYTTSTLLSPTYYHVRLDIARTYPLTAGVGQYVMKAYIVRGSSLPCTAAGTIDNLTTFLDTTGFCTPTITDTITINDSVTPGSEAMKKVYLGFTTSQRLGNSRKQNLSIGNFAAQNH
jgi:hypothetical protein